MKWADISALLIVFTAPFGAWVGCIESQPHWKAIFTAVGGGLLLGMALGLISSLVSYRILRMDRRREPLALPFYILSPLPILAAAYVFSPPLGSYIALALR